MHIYVFGSTCRGDILPSSDVDLLAIVDGYDSRFDPNIYSIYSYQRIKEIWDEGNPFAWHLSLESRLPAARASHPITHALGDGSFLPCHAIAKLASIETARIPYKTTGVI